MPVVEFVRFESTDEVGLVEHRDRLIELLREQYREDFVHASLARCDDGSFLELITWASADAAHRAASEMPGDPRAAGFFTRIGTVREMGHAELLHHA
ncbi:hypothetical protein G6027_10615 [Dietzia sp. SLG310A2-38A2]|uniref:hypothetical protein n=1 Tax=Dietzia sp. SLG310A2-38A2 TaxID=1630643 RepID=UPI0015FB33AE|nr:hypothetical protein [Dietzia sp. SLG310A2-38A2]MBB1031330.1 hypothetical protein [Dietzia sp. SLG310A2-38A2]